MDTISHPTGMVYTKRYQYDALLCTNGVASKMCANRTIFNDFNDLHALAWGLHGGRVASQFSDVYPASRMFPVCGTMLFDIGFLGSVQSSVDLSGGVS